MVHVTWGRRHWGAVYLTALVLIVGAGSYTLSTAAVHRANRAAATVTQLCMSGNEFRAEQIGLWEYVIRVSKPPAHETPAAREHRLAVVAAFDAHLHQVFKPRDCAHPGR